LDRDCNNTHDLVSIESVNRTLLTLVLCVLVLLPQRFCTCAAAGGCLESSCPAQPVVAADPFADETDARRCHKHGHADWVGAESLSQAAPVIPDNPAPKPTRHDPDCPATKTSVSSVSLRPTAPVSIEPSIDLQLLEIAIESPRSALRQSSQLNADPPHVPLYLSLLVLRN
jgi:hypothetical protein